LFWGHFVKFFSYFYAGSIKNKGHLRDAMTSERLLLQKIASGDENAFRELFDQYRQLVFRFAYMHLRSEALADEITQEVFIKVWTAGEKLLEISSFEAWIKTVTRNLTYSWFRKIKLQREMLARYAAGQTEEGLDTTSQEMALSEASRLLQDALSSLTEKQRTIFRMSREENMQYTRIAAELGISEHTVNYHLKKVLAHLRDVLGNNIYALLPGITLFFSDFF
jgi:RNA polymerase sigma-70 factor (ECF subfamily)